MNPAATGAVYRPVACVECHPNNAGNNAHSNRRVNVTFAAATGANLGAFTATFTLGNGTTTATTCATYCHGATLGAPATGSVGATWSWNSATAATCGTCHAFPPTVSHTGVLAAATMRDRCHGGTVNTDGTINVAGGLHINGQLDGGGEPATGGSSCGGCHTDYFNRMTAVTGAPVSRHALGSDVPADGAFSWTGTDLTTSVAIANRTCISMCHGDHPHTVTSPAAAGHANNVFLDATTQATRAVAATTRIGTGGTGGTQNRARTDFDTVLNVGLCADLPPEAHHGERHHRLGRDLRPLGPRLLEQHGGGDDLHLELRAPRRQQLRPQLHQVPRQPRRGQHAREHDHRLRPLLHHRHEPARRHHQPGRNGGQLRLLQLPRLDGDSRRRRPGQPLRQGHPDPGPPRHHRQPVGPPIELRHPAQLGRRVHERRLRQRAGRHRWRRPAPRQLHGLPRLPRGEADVREPRVTGSATNGNVAGPALQGAWGAQLTSNPAFFTAPTSANFTKKMIVAGTDLQATLCFKCHTGYYWGTGTPPTSPSGAFAETDQAKEFNPANVGNYATTGTTSWQTGRDRRQLPPCPRECRGQPGRHRQHQGPLDANQPHDLYGLSRFGLDHRSEWPARLGRKVHPQGTEHRLSDTLVTTSTGMPANTFCINCHNQAYTGGRFTGGSLHTRGNHLIACFNCHAAVPHGGPRPGLLVAGAGAATAVGGAIAGWDTAAPYWQGGTTDRLYLKTYPASNTAAWDRPNCGCDGTGH